MRLLSYFGCHHIFRGGHCVVQDHPVLGSSGSSCLRVAISWPRGTPGPRKPSSCRPAVHVHAVDAQNPCTHADVADHLTELRTRETGQGDGFACELVAELSSLGHDTLFLAMIGLHGSARINGVEPPGP